MRFTLNALIVSTVALLSTSVVNAQDGVEFTSPAAGQTVDLSVKQTVSVTWTVTDATVVTGDVDIVLVSSSDAPVPQTSSKLNLNPIPVSNGQADVTFSDGAGQFFLELLSTDTSKETVPGQEFLYTTSGIFTVVD